MKKKPASLTVVYSIVLILALALAGAGVWLAITQHVWSMLAAGAASVVGVLIAWPIATQLCASYNFSCSNAEKTWSDVNDRLEQFSVMLNLISEQQLISDRAKTVAFRDKDAEALRRAIQDEILEQHWEAAETLISEMERQFGFRGEAEQLRNQISTRLNENIRRQMSEATTVIDRYVRAEAWADAMREGNRIAAALPNHPPAVNMPQEIEQRRQLHKKQLIGSWNDAVARHDVDGAIDILKRLDSYLTPAEAEPFQETARHIFKEKLQLLRDQFTAAVKDEHWTDAVRLAEIIIRDFPNTQMAREARDSIDSLRERAGVAPATARA